MQYQQRNKYLETTIQTASPQQLLIMLYDGAIRACKGAIEAIGKGQIEESHRQLMKVTDIINEFVITLDRSVPMAENLLLLYDYFLVRLREAVISKQEEPVQEVLGYLMEMKEAWVQAAKQLGSKAGTAVGGTV